MAWRSYFSEDWKADIKWLTERGLQKDIPVEQMYSGNGALPVRPLPSAFPIQSDQRYSQTLRRAPKSERA